MLSCRGLTPHTLSVPFRVMTKITAFVFLVVSEVTYIAESNVRNPLFARDRFKRAGYNKCLYGSYQTPIHVENNRFESMVMPAIDFSGYGNYLPPPVTLINTGRTVRLTAGRYSEGGIYDDPFITGGLLDGRYVWDSLHFHWGKENTRGSEHVINNVRYPMEMHIVHRRSNYGSRDEALEFKDGLAVLAFVFELQMRDNRKLKPIVSKLKDVREEGSRANVSRTFSLFTILPRNTDLFFTYEGSLSSPPCSESVTWMLFPTPIKISHRQMEQFRSLSIPENFRPLQPVGQRRVFLRQTKRFIKPEFAELSRTNVSSSLFWLKLR